MGTGKSQVETAGLQEAYDLFKASESAELLLCLTTQRIPLGSGTFPQDFVPSEYRAAPRGGGNGHSGYHSVAAGSDADYAAISATKNCLRDVIFNGGSTKWRTSLAEIRFFFERHSCRGLVNPTAAIDRLMKEHPKTGELFADKPYQCLKAEPYLGIYAPAPHSFSTTVELPSFDIHFPLLLKPTLDQSSFEDAWAKIREGFRQEAIAAIVTLQNDDKHMIFYGPPSDGNKKLNACQEKSQCALRDSPSKICGSGSIQESKPIFSTGKLNTWILNWADPTRCDYRAIWRSIETLAIGRQTVGTLEPQVVVNQGGKYELLSVGDFWSQRWSTGATLPDSTPVGCTFARPTNDASGVSLDICGTPSDFFRLLFQPTICRNEQLIYKTHNRRKTHVEITIDIPRQTQPAKKQRTLSLNGNWPQMSVPQNFADELHPALQFATVGKTVSDWQDLFDTADEGLLH